MGDCRTKQCFIPDQTTKKSSCLHQPIWREREGKEALGRQNLPIIQISWNSIPGFVFYSQLFLHLPSPQVIVTDCADQALSLLQTVPLHGCDGVVSVGGDGMFAEVFNGIIIRAARDAKLDIDKKTTQFVKPDIRVGFIPGGEHICVIKPCTKHFC